MSFPAKHISNKPVKPVIDVIKVTPLIDVIKVISSRDSNKYPQPAQKMKIFLLSGNKKPCLSVRSWKFEK